MKKFLFAILSPMLLSACTTDAYEKGEGTYSQLQADFVEAHSSAERKVDYVVTDSDERLIVSQPVGRDWITTPDSLYRCVIYYHRNGTMAENVSITEIGTVSPISADTLRKRDIKMKMDPLTFQSLWVSKNKRYLNACIYLKSGTTTVPLVAHRLAVVSDSVVTHPNHRQTLCLSLYHDQGGVPEYYSSQTYFSVALKAFTADSIRFSMNTYDGLVTKVVSIR